MNIYSNLEHQLNLLSETIEGLSDELYTTSSGELSCIGAHVRHVVECLQILEYAEEGGVIDYAKRKRNKLLEEDRALVKTEIARLKHSLLRKGDFDLQVSDDDDLFKTTYQRELLAQHEHIVHHCAIIKIQLTICSDMKLDPCLGMAKSTLAYRNTNVSA